MISPEGCSSILWRDSENAKEAAEALKMTARDLMALGVVDVIVDEPVGGAHRDPAVVLPAVGDALEAAWRELTPIPGGELRARRRQRFLDIGKVGLD